MCEIIDGLSMDVEQSNKDKLKTVFPECFAEGKLDIDKLLSLCGEYIDNDFEKYKFEWNGKSECLKLAQKRSTGTLRPCPEESVNFDTTQNLYIEGDNLEVLKLLQSAYYRKVKMIYIDPPYNTGNDFVYADNFSDPIARYKEVTQQTTKSNPESMGRFHTNWLNMMYPRLRLAANLLRDDGVIFISIDDNEVTNLRKICDEVFGEENYIGIYLKQSKVGGGSDSKFIVKEHEYCLVYCKNINSAQEMFVEHDEEYLKRYKEIDDNGRYFWDTFARPGLKNPIHYDITAPDGTVMNYGWIHGKERYEQELKEGKVRIILKSDGGWSVQFKQYLNDNGKKPRSMTMDFGGSIEGKNDISNLFENDKLFSYPKSVKYISTLIKTLNDKNALILDFFSGSATTAHAVMQLNAGDGGNRKFICVQIPELCNEKSEAYKAGYKNICEIGKERIRRAGAKILAEMNEQNRQLEIGAEEKPLPDVGFKVFKLDTSNLKTWDSTPVTEDDMPLLLDRMNGMINRVKSDRSDMDMVCEIMLKLGVPLTYIIGKIELNGKTAYTIGEDCLLLICLAEDVQPEDVEAMAEYAPAKVIIARDSFADDTAMANAHYILRDRGIELKLV